ncbi:MAG: DUF192 domain-containing protein [Burkholderiaceae bacterium]|nr:DUF192 domain-containing protein [Burkholderiaceae bacterium]
MLASFTERLRGVLGREPRDHMTGYWLVPCRSVHGIGLSQSLDLVYLDCGLRVIRAVGGFRPWRLSACPEANSVIEMRAGALENWPVLRPGSRLSLHDRERV